MTTGLNPAREEGKLERNLEIALSFKKLGVPVEQIAQGTGLSIEEIKRL
jgi:predicted transposase/invertase (TIGR01784 family)